MRRQVSGRQASIYVFAWHGIVDQTADHRDVTQWEFYVLAERDLPNQHSIGLMPLRNLSRSLNADALSGRVESIRLEEELRLD